MAQKKNKRNRRKAGPLQKRARRDVRFAIDPILDEIRRQQDISEREYEQNASRVENIYADLGRELQRAGAGYDPRAQQISADLNAALGGLTGLITPNAESAVNLNPEGQAAEAGAATGMFGAIGATGQTMLASDRSRQNAWDTSLQREVPLQSADFERRFLQDFRDTIEDLKQQRFDTMRDVPSQVLARLDQLRDSRRQNKLAQAELALREQIADREGDRADKAFRHEKKSANKATDFAQSEIDRRQSHKEIKNLRGDIGLLKDARGPISKELRNLLEGRTPGELAQTNRDEQLRRKRRDYTQKIKRKRKKIQRLR